MKVKFSLILILFCLVSFSQIKILGELDLTKRYEFYISSGPLILEDGKEKESNDFIYTDQNVIHEIIKTWKGIKTNDYLMCGYNYYIYIICENKIIDYIKVNDECRHLIYSMGAVNIQSNPFAKLDSISKFSSFTYKTTDKNKAMSFMNSITKLKDIYCGNCDNYNFADIEENYIFYIFGKADIVNSISNSR